MTNSSPAPAHTPGPWKVVMNGDDEWDGKQDLHIGFEGPEKQCVLNGCGECGSPWCNNPADARLIAAAPELLAACKRMLRFIAEPRPDWNEAEEMLEAAIAKAEGSAA